MQHLIASCVAIADDAAGTPSDDGGVTEERPQMCSMCARCNALGRERVAAKKAKTEQKSVAFGGSF